MSHQHILIFETTVRCYRGLCYSPHHSLGDLNTWGEGWKGGWSYSQSPVVGTINSYEKINKSIIKFVADIIDIISFRCVIVVNLMYIGTALENNILPPKNNI